MVLLGIVDSRENLKLLDVSKLNFKVDLRENKISHKKVCMTCIFLYEKERKKVVTLWAEMIAVGNGIIPNRRSHEKIYDNTTTTNAGVGRPC